ncbi:MAG: STN domain-containing protein [Elusimicrobia bacterium]|nr:STN domain-containing protein [Elusimicrobiota bacterium]
MIGLAAALLWSACDPASAQEPRPPEVPYYRVWRGVSRPGLDAPGFLSRLAPFVVRTRAWLGRHGGLAYLPALPPAGSGPEVPAELALVVYASERGYRDDSATREGEAYGAAHWRLFDKPRSRGNAAIPYIGKLLADTPYDVAGGTASWASPQGTTRFYLGRLREKTPLEQLASWVGRVGAGFGTRGMDGYVVAVDGRGVVCSWQHWAGSGELEAAAASEAGREIFGARDSLLETIMDAPAEPFAGQVEPGRAYQVLLPAEAADPMQARVTIRVKDAPLTAFLDLVSSQAGLNFILADGLEGVRVTAFLTDVTARDALELLRVTKGLTYHRVESRGATVIAPAARESPDLRTKVYPLENVPSEGR